MKIAFFAHDTVLYGANRSLLNLLKGIQNSSPTITVKVFCPKKGDFTNALHKIGINHEITPFFNSRYVANSFSFIKSIYREIQNQKAYFTVRKKLDAFKPDLVHSNSSDLHIGAWLAYDLKIPHVWHVREFGLEDYNMKFNFGRKNFEKWANRSQAIIAISHAIQQKVLYNIKAPVHQIYNGVFSPKDLTGLPQQNTEKTIFCIVGGLYPKKGQDLAIKAFAEKHLEMPDAALWIVGSGIQEYQKQLESLIAENNIENKVKLLGYQENGLEWISQSHIGLMCSEQEAMGRVTAEYMACGIPVIGRNTAGTAELVEHNQEGLLFTNVGELADHMALLYHNRELRKKLGANGKQKAFACFSQEQYTERMLRIFSDIKASKRDS